MKIYHFGDSEKAALMLLPGFFTHWKTNFNYVIPYLEKTYHVMVVSYDGFDETEDSTFTSVTAEVEKIEKYVLDNLNGHIHAIYGSLEGGLIAGLIAQRENVTFDAMVLGCSELNQAGSLTAKARAKSIAGKAYKALQSGELPRIMSAFTPLVDMKFVSEDSVYNQAYTGLTTELGKNILPKVGKVHIIYSEIMGGVYLQRYNKHFADIDLMVLDYPAEQLLVKYPKQFSIVLRRMTKDLK